jgi:trans-2,3-dihydro-3-hydroxyanthranilate isomerase
VAEELPFAGHPSLGTAVAVARARGDSEARYVQQTGAGLQPIDVRLDGDARAHASMLQEPASFGPELAAERALPAVGLAAEEAHPDLPLQLVSTGIAHLLAPLRYPAALGRVQPDWPALDALLFEIDAVTLYLAWWDAERGAARARSFARGFAAEDPATGSAAGPLCAYLSARAGAAAVTIAQGVEMGRPSRLEAAVEGDRIRVGGDVVTIVDGTLTL